MPHNTLPPGFHDLTKLAQAMCHGLETHAPWLNMGSANAENFRPRLETFLAAETEFALARSAKAAAGARAAASDAALLEWLGKARLVVMLALGSRWSPAWIGAGFTKRGTNVPKRVAGRLGLARSLVAFFRRHAQFAVVFAGVDAPHGAALIAEAESVRRAFRETTADAGRKKALRDAAETALRREMRLVKACASFSFGKSDARWAAFGMRPPEPCARRRERRAVLPPPEVIPLPTAAETASESVAA